MENAIERLEEITYLINELTIDVAKLNNKIERLETETKLANKISFELGKACRDSFDQTKEAATTLREELSETYGYVVCD